MLIQQDLCRAFNRALQSGQFLSFFLSFGWVGVGFIEHDWILWVPITFGDKLKAPLSGDFEIYFTHFVLSLQNWLTLKEGEEEKERSKKKKRLPRQSRAG